MVRLWKEEVRHTVAVARYKEFKRVLPFRRVTYPEFSFVAVPKYPGFSSHQ